MSSLDLQATSKAGTYTSIGSDLTSNRCHVQRSEQRLRVAAMVGLFEPWSLWTLHRAMVSASVVRIRSMNPYDIQSL